MAGENRKNGNGDGLDLLDREDTDTKPKLEKPKMYKVLLHNDDYTDPMFVIGVLQKVFKIGFEKAKAIMMTAHQTGLCLVCVYTKDIAETKVAAAMDLAKRVQAPLMFTSEPED